jgi:hypothetical protein
MLKAAPYYRVSSNKQEEKNSIACYSATMVNETGRKNPKDKSLKLALNGLGWMDDAIREFVSLESLLFRAP